MIPTYGYIVSVPRLFDEKYIGDIRENIDRKEGIFGKNSPNYLSWLSEQDWSVVDDHFRISGEDHFSAFKQPFLEERGKSLSNWIYETYPFIKKTNY